MTIKSVKEIKGVNRNGSSKIKITGQLSHSDLEKKIKQAQQRIQNIVWLSFEKAVAHYENPSMYPLPSGRKSVEKSFHDLLGELPKGKRNKAIDKINETLKASPAARAGRYKDIVNVNFSSALPIAEQVKAMAVPDELKFTEEEATALAEKYKVNAPELTKAAEKENNDKGKKQVRQAVSSSKVSFSVDNMTCLNPDDVLKDEVSLTGFAIDTAGTNTELAPFFVGKFRKDETVLLNGNSRLFTMPIDSNIETNTFLVGLIIVEGDLISNQRTVDLLTGIFALIGVLAMAVAIALFFVNPLAALYVLCGAGLFNILAHYFIPLLGDDISFAATDTLTFTGKLDVGKTFERTLTIGKGFDIDSTFDGKYTAAARWVGEL